MSAQQTVRCRPSVARRGQPRPTLLHQGWKECACPSCSFFPCLPCGYLPRGGRNTPPPQLHGETSRRGLHLWREWLPCLAAPEMEQELEIAGCGICPPRCAGRHLRGKARADLAPPHPPIKDGDTYDVCRALCRRACPGKPRRVTPWLHNCANHLLYQPHTRVEVGTVKVACGQRGGGRGGGRERRATCCMAHLLSLLSRARTGIPGSRKTETKFPATQPPHRSFPLSFPLPVMACQSIANVVKSSLGPVGLDKMLVDAIGDTTVTNDGATILNLLEVDHPAGKVLVELAQLQVCSALHFPACTRELCAHFISRIACCCNCLPARARIFCVCLVFVCAKRQPNKWEDEVNHQGWTVWRRGYTATEHTSGWRLFWQALGRVFQTSAPPRPVGKVFGLAPSRLRVGVAVGSGDPICG